MPMEYEEQLQAAQRARQQRVERERKRRRKQWERLERKRTGRKTIGVLIGGFLAYFVLTCMCAFVVMLALDNIHDGYRVAPNLGFWTCVNIVVLVQALAIGANLVTKRKNV